MTCLVPDADGTAAAGAARPQGDPALLPRFPLRRRCSGASSTSWSSSRKRIHILEGFKIIFNALDKAIKLIRESEGKAGRRREADEGVQARRDPDRRDPRRAALQDRPDGDQEDPRRAAARRRARPSEIEAILASKTKLWSVVKDELDELGEKFGDRRRTAHGVRRGRARSSTRKPTSSARTPTSC